MLVIKDGKVVAEAVCFSDEAGALMKVNIDGLWFSRCDEIGCPIWKKPLVDAHAIKKAFDAPDKGERVMRQKGGSPIYKNILDECRKAKTWSEVVPVLMRYYPGWKESSVRVEVNKYKRALLAGTPSVPVSSLSSVKASRRRRRPADGMFYDKTSHIWVRTEEYNMVASHVMSLEKVTMRELAVHFGSRIKSYHIPLVVAHMIRAGLIKRRYGDNRSVLYYPVRESVGHVVSSEVKQSDRLEDIVK